MTIRMRDARGQLVTAESLEFTGPHARYTLLPDRREHQDTRYTTHCDRIRPGDLLSAHHRWNVEARPQMSAFRKAS